MSVLAHICLLIVFLSFFPSIWVPHSISALLYLFSNPFHFFATLSPLIGKHIEHTINIALLTLAIGVTFYLQPGFAMLSCKELLPSEDVVHVVTMWGSLSVEASQRASQPAPLPHMRSAAIHYSKFFSWTANMQKCRACRKHFKIQYMSHSCNQKHRTDTKTEVQSFYMF